MRLSKLQKWILAKAYQKTVLHDNSDLIRLDNPNKWARDRYIQWLSYDLDNNEDMSNNGRILKFNLERGLRDALDTDPQEGYIEYERPEKPQVLKDFDAQYYENGVLSMSALRGIPKFEDIDLSDAPEYLKEIKQIRDRLSEIRAGVNDTKISNQVSMLLFEVEIALNKTGITKVIENKAKTKEIEKIEIKYNEARDIFDTLTKNRDYYWDYLFNPEILVGFFGAETDTDRWARERIHHLKNVPQKARVTLSRSLKTMRENKLIERWFWGIDKNGRYGASYQGLKLTDTGKEIAKDLYYKIEQKKELMVA